MSTPILTTRPSVGALRTVDFHGLWAITIVLLLLFHATTGTILPGGFIGVDIFLVVSGFLVTDLFLRMESPSGWSRVAQLLAHRSRVTLPLSALVLLTTAIATTVIFPSFQWGEHGLEILTASLFAVNWQFMANPPELLPNLASATELLPYPLLHYWALAVDAQFLLLWAVILTVVVYFSRPDSTRVRGRSKRRVRQHRVQRNARWAAVTLTLISLAWAVVSSLSDLGLTPEQSYFSTSTRLWELGLGAVLATFSTQLAQLSRTLGQILAAAGLMGILVAASFYDLAFYYPGYAALLPACATAAVITGMLSHPNAGVNRLFNNPVIRWVGKLSLALYLWHWPVLVFGGHLLGATPTATQGVFLVLLSFLPAWISYRLVAVPLSRWSSIKYSTTNALSMGLLLILVCFLFGLLLMNVARF